MRAIACIELLFLALAGLTACDRSSELLLGGNPDEIRTIAHLKSLCEGDCVTVTQDITLRGFVTANDCFGEFYKTLVIQDPSGGIAIAADHPELFLDYSVGDELTIRCNGLVLCEYGGKVQLGTAPVDDSGAGRIPRTELERYLRRTGRIADPIPVVTTIPQIGQSQVDTYVRLEGVRFTELAAWCDTDPLTHRTITTERTVEDGAKNAFRVRTLGSCIYAKEPVPSGTGSLSGIVDCFNGRYSLRVVNREVVFAPTATPPKACP
ncbi:DUF5689 domain-containing protein [Alistipes sp.]|uniref:DUF5689 domain-containing protein n=1 Tax=Alistipes sp. TaxID=1872444 RepID=UPI003AF17A36